jgi:outer membrane lipoprotein SlyB
MKALYPVSILFGVTMASAGISPSAAQSGLEGTTHGIIDSVHTQPGTPIVGYADALEHAVGPSEQIVVRLDDGQALTLVQNSPDQFAPGERVLLSRSKAGIRLEHAPRFFATPS